MWNTEWLYTQLYCCMSYYFRFSGILGYNISFCLKVLLYDLFRTSPESINLQAFAAKTRTEYETALNQ